MHIQVSAEPFNPYQALADYQQQLTAGQYGACASFTGMMRDFNLGSTVTELYLDYYPEMTERLLLDYASVLQEQYDFLDMLVIHRVGRIKPADAIVLVAVWSAHRAAAFDSCRDMMEYLKAKATFWKKELLTENNETRWVKNL